MEKKKSLGSTPIGYNINQTSYSFIRDINGPAKDERSLNGSDEERTDDSGSNKIEMQSSKPATSQEEEPSEKKVVSYYLEVSLIQRLKNIADKNGNYYSSLVSKAIKAWIKHHEC